MEPVRADVDAFLLDLLEDRTFTARDFGELANGICTFAAPLTHELALTLPHWRERLRRSGRASHKRSANRSSIRAQRLAHSRLNPGISAAVFSDRSDRHCSQRLARPRSHVRTPREHGVRRPSKRSRAQAAAGNDPRRGAGVNRARGEAISEGHRRNRSWAREHPAQRDEAWFKREITPKLDAFTLAEIAAATGLSLAACSRIRASAKVPHPWHWEGLLALVEAGN